MKSNGGQVVIGGDNLPSLVRIGLTDLQNIGGASGPPGSGITEVQLGEFFRYVPGKDFKWPWLKLQQANNFIYRKFTALPNKQHWSY